jgi:hypothetical protein
MIDKWVFVGVVFVVMLFVGIVLNRFIHNNQPMPFRDNLRCVLLKHKWIKRLPHIQFQPQYYDCDRCGKHKLAGYGYYEEFWVEE